MIKHNFSVFVSLGAVFTFAPMDWQNLFPKTPKPQNIEIYIFVYIKYT